MILRLIRLSFGVVMLGLALADVRALTASGEVHVWETQEIILQASQDYPNPYAEVDCWIELEGPGFAKRVYGFWDGGHTFRVRFVATAPGEWH